MTDAAGFNNPSIKGRHIYFLVNPSAGGQSARRSWERLLPELTQRVAGFSWGYTAGAGTAVAQVRTLLDRGFKIIIAAGGDGTLNELVNGFIENGRLYKEGTAIGFWPLGSECDFSRAVYKESSTEYLLRLLRDGEIRNVDAASCTYSLKDGGIGRRCYINSFDVGIGANTVFKVNQGNQRLGRKTSFMAAAVKNLWTYKCVQMQIEADSQKFSGSYCMVAVGNGQFSGGGMCLLPGALVDDGLLDMMLVDKAGRLKLLKSFPLVYAGAHADLEIITMLRVKKVSIKAEVPLLIECDGENVGYTDVDIGVLPGVLPMLLPKKA